MLKKRNCKGFWFYTQTPSRIFNEVINKIVNTKISFNENKRAYNANLVKNVCEQFIRGELLSVHLFLTNKEHKYKDKI